MNIPLKTVLVERPGYPDGVMINAEDFNQETDVLFRAISESDAAAKALQDAQDALKNLMVAKAPADEVIAAEQAVKDAEALVASLTPAK